ncbi:MAG: MFS transporter [Planctomycetaceae bacterium]|nr:MFS transporter [Planctomycetaceae bacterium]
MPWFSRSGPRKPVNWKSNLVAVWLSQFISLSAFYFCLPFLPLYLKEKQIVPLEEVSYWSGVFIAAAPISMMIMSPIWGALGDRYGRKMMLVRSTLAGAFVLYLMSVVDNIEALVVLRLLQGAFTGTIPSAQSLVSASTPEKNQSFALGLMMAAINAAYTAGAYFGGIYAQHFGAEATFKMAGYLLLVSTIMVLALVWENFTPPARLSANTRSARLRQRRASITQFRTGIPALLIIAFIALLQTYDGPYLPLYVESIVIGGSATVASISGEVYRMTGNINALASIIAVGGSISISYIMDKKTPRIAWALLAVGCSLGVWVIGWVETIAGLTLGRTMFLFFVSGLASVLVVLLSRLTPSHKRGAAMGWTVTARCIGWAVAPMLGSLVEQRYGYHAAYWWLGILSLMLIPAFLWLTGRYPEAFRPPAEDEADEPLEGDVILPPQSLPITPQQTSASVRGRAEKRG